MASPARSTTAPRATQIALVAAVVSILFQSIGPIFVRESGMPGLAFAFHRMWIAAAAYALLSLAMGRPVTWRALRISVSGGLFFAFNVSMFFTALQYTSVANAIVIGALQPAALLLVVNRLFGERVTRRDLAFTGVSILGVAVVVFAGASADTGDPLGDLLAFLAMLGFAAYFVSSKQARATLGAFEYQSALSVVAAVALLPAVFVLGTDLAAPKTSSWLWAVAMVAVPGTGHLLFNYAHAYVRLSLMSVITLLAPACTAFFAWILLDERLVLAQIVGMAITIAGVAFMVRRAPAPSG